ncbi:hypothetical protein MBLNU459_g3111t1 [Dothideomycetes sp. NU459]
MPHAVDEFELQDQRDDAEIARLLNPDNTEQDSLDFLNRELDEGEKADDAQDFEDIGDDDLADDEDEVTGKDGGQDAQGANDDFDAYMNGHDLGGAGGGHHDVYEDEPDLAFEDDLFGEDDTMPLPDGDEQEAPAAQPVSAASGLALPSKTRIALPGSFSQKSVLHDAPTFDTPASLSAPQSDDLADEDADQSDVKMEEDDEEDEQWAMQKALFAAANKEREERLQRGGLWVAPTAAEDELESFYTIWPTYDPDETPRFTDLFPPRRGIYGWRAPQKPPKPVQPTKLNLELQPDQEKASRLPVAAAANKPGRELGAEQHGIIHCKDTHMEQEHSDDGLDFDEIDENETIGGITWQDLTLVCEDWDVPSGSSSPNPASQQADSGVDMSHDWEHDSQQPPTKRRKISHFDLKTAVSISHAYPSLEDPERATAQIAKKVELDMNDAGLLLDENVPAAQPKKIRRVAGDMRREAKSAVARDMCRRYNISNDEAYELLKENHQHKVRSTLGSMAVEHSLPATKLQWPFYKVNLEDKDKRSFHRPSFGHERPGRNITFHKLKKIKRKELRGKEPTAIFAKSEDLSMADNSSALLLEYSEELPVMLSNFGMGNRLINYYRRKDAEDSSRPKEEIGETQVLLPQDRSPFANFGQVDPGEMIPTIHNGLYRAPIFRHDGKPTDFLIMRDVSNALGSRYHIRNVENLYAVGQQFPSVEVPGEHSRKVTDAAKRRLRAISYRVYKKHVENRGDPLTNDVVRSHLPGSDIAQNRGKMREFMQYDKNRQLWQLKPGDTLPDADTLRTWIKPEDICVLDSMQVGVQHLKDLGLRKEDDENDDDDAKEGSNIELQLAPWNTTKNFLNACQGKAMLQLHGEGDPSARGEAFSFIKTSMKGGFRALGESIEERLDAKRLKENGGHSYNVARQQKAYDESIRRIWKAQYESLSSNMEHSDAEGDVDDDEPEPSFGTGATPRSSFGTPAAFARRDDESASQLSRFSSNQNNKYMMITRSVKDKYGNITELSEKVDNPRVIAAYKKRKLQQKTAGLDVLNMGSTDDQDLMDIQRQKVQAEIDRLQRNMDRREARERAKGILPSPSAAPSPAPDGTEAGESATPVTGKKGRSKKNTEGTARKCANCGQVGHIKTNKKYASNFLICNTCVQIQSEGGVVEDRGNSRNKTDQEKKFRWFRKSSHIRLALSTHDILSLFQQEDPGVSSTPSISFSTPLPPRKTYIQAEGLTDTPHRLCPMLNGTMKQEDVTASGFGGPPGAGAQGSGDGGAFGSVPTPLQL